MRFEIAKKICQNLRFNFSAEKAAFSTWCVTDEVMNELAEMEADVVEYRQLFVCLYLEKQAHTIDELDKCRAQRVGHWIDDVSGTVLNKRQR